MKAFEAADRWEVANVALGVIGPDGRAVTRGDAQRSYRIASLAKVVTAYTVAVAVEERTLSLDQPAGPPGATLRHLLAHAAGYGFESGSAPIARPGARRIYSNRGIEEAASALASAAGIGFDAYQREAVLDPLAMTSTTLRGSPAHAMWSTIDDLLRFAAELRQPRLIDPTTRDELVRVQFPGLTGVLPGVGRFDPLDWGLGFERNFARPGHWAGRRVAPETFGHFGGAGTFLWVDPVHHIACIALTDREFDSWALDVWPPFCDAVIDEITSSPA